LAKKATGGTRPPRVPHDVGAIRKQIRAFLDSEDADGNVPCNAKCGVYVFYDYDGEPIYVGKTNERLRSRILRHLTNQRTDAVAMNVLDPYEVAEIEVYPFPDLERPARGETRDEYAERMKRTLGSAESTVYQKVLRASAIGAVLNEKAIPEMPRIRLPRSHRGPIIPEDLYEHRKHPDVRIARRANTVANLARVISERQTSKGLRKTLVVQAQRIERLARQRLEDFADMPEEALDEETGDAE
jgi:GIY-YIG catalytic domain